MADYLTDTTELTSIADAIRAKGGTSAALEYPTGYVTAIANIPSGGGTDTSDATMTSGDQMLSGVTAYSKGTKYTGTIQTKTSSDLTASGATVTVPKGYYASATSKSVSSGSATAPASISGSSASISTSTNLITLSKTISVTPTVSAGYVSSGTAGNSSVSLSASVTTKGATTYTPGTSNQTIASGTYLTGAQTISGDANLIAGNIKSGVSIFNIAGSYTGGGGGIVTPVTAGNTPVAGNLTIARTSTSSLSDSGVTLTIPAAGTWRLKWVAFRTNTSSSYTWSTRLYKGSTAVGTEVTSWTQSYYQLNSLDLTCAKDDVIHIYARGRGGTYYVFVGMLTACINATLF